MRRGAESMMFAAVGNRVGPHIVCAAFPDSRLFPEGCTLGAVGRKMVLFSALVSPLLPLFASLSHSPSSLPLALSLSSLLSSSLLHPLFSVPFFLFYLLSSPFSF